MTSIPPVTPGFLGQAAADPPREPSRPLPAYSFSNTWSEGWRAFTSNWGALTGAICLTTIVYIIVAFIPLIGGIAAIFIAPVLDSAAYLAVRAVRGQPVSIDRLIEQLKGRYWWVMLMRMLIGFAIGLAMVPVMIAAVIVVLVTLNAGWGLMLACLTPVFIAYFILIAYSYGRMALAVALIFDAPPGKVNCIDAIVQSWKLTRDQAWSLCAVYLIGMMAVTGSLLLLIVGYFLIGIPLFFAVTGAAAALIIGDTNQRVCPGCSYAITGLKSDRCPECGSNLFGLDR